MSSDGKVRVVVRSRRVPVRPYSWQTPAYSASGVRHGFQTEHGLVYETVLDTQQLRAIEEARRLSDSTGLALEVVDLGKRSLLQRIFGGILQSDGDSSLPEIRLRVPNPAGIGCEMEPRARALA